MADINQIITLGIGTPGDVEHFVLFGLTAEGSAPPVIEPPREITLSEYMIVIKSPVGVRRAIVVDFLSLEYAKERNAVGVAIFSLSGGHAAIAEIEDKSQVEIWRRNRGQNLDWYVDFYGLVRNLEWENVDPGILTVECDEQNVMLAWRVIAWPAGLANRTKFEGVAGETIMKTLVEYNAAASATTLNGRKRAGIITGVSVETDGGGGSTLDWYCAPKAGRTLLKELQDLAKISGGDWEFAKTGALAWEFRWHLGQLGDDLSASVIFSMAYDNMANPRARIQRAGEQTVALVAGQGEGENRLFVSRTGTNYGAGNDIEVFVDARDVASTDGLNSKGDRVLEQAVALEAFNFDVLQTVASAYGKDYQLGDLVKVVSPFTGLATTRCVQAVSVKVLDSGGDEIKVETVET